MTVLMRGSLRPILIAVVVLATLLLPVPLVAAPGPPTADSQPGLRTPQDTALPITLAGHDAGAGDTMTFLATDPANGTLNLLLGVMSCNPSGQNCTADVIYTPDPGYKGPDSFTFTVTDSEVPPESSDPATISIAVNALPVANADPRASCQAGGRYLATEETQLVVGVGPCDLLNNDMDADTGDSLTAVLETDVTNGTLALASDGTFTYDPDPNVWSAAGTTTDSFTYRASDGLELSSPATVLINVAAVNDDPSFTKGADQAVDEDAGAQTVAGWATAISSGPNESDTLTFEITANDNSGLFQAGPEVAANGTLTYTPAANANGEASITLRLNDGQGGITPTQSFLITVDSVNDAPTFMKGANESVAEDAGAITVTGWATDMSKGPANESGQVLTFSVVGNSNTAIFSVAPAVSATTGTLTYTVAAGESGSSTITLRLSDDGGTANGGVNFSEQTFTINVGSENDPPSFTKGGDEAVLEDAGAQSVPGWATSISQGAGDSGQVLTFVVTDNTNTALFSSQPAVAANGTLTYAPAANANGSATITLVLSDDGGGTDTSGPATFTIAVGAVNDAPTYTKAANPSVSEDSGARTVTGFASGIAEGPANEAAQFLAFSVVGNTNTGLFSAQPAVAGNGSLTFTPAANKHGSATFTLRLSDNGGTANGGVDHLDRSVTITVTSVNDAPNAANDVGLTVNQNVAATPIAVLANDSALPDTGETLDITAASAPGHGTVTITGGGTGLTYTPAPTYRGSDLFTYTLSDGGLTDTATVLLEVVQAGTVTRLSGADRYATSAAISKANYAANVSVVYIANGTGFADALSGAPVAGKLGGPILLIPGTTIPTVIATELIRLKPAKIVILGGTGAVSAGVATALDAYTTGTVTRLSGADRYATSAAISKANYAANVSVVYIANGTGFADALSGAPVAGKLGGPILLIPGTTIPTVIATELIRLKPAKIVILGGTGAVSAGVATALDAYTTGTVTRLSGADRYATSAAISKANYAANVSVVYIANGTGFADALSGAPVAGKLGGPILLIPGTTIPTVIATELIRLKPAKIVILGGTGAVSAGVATSLGFYTSAP